jgi:hypothetical protein
LRIRLAKEHVTPAASSVGGEHKQGSAIDWFQTTAPTTRPDGVTALTTDDLGRTWCDTTNNVLKMLTAIGSPNTWTPYGELCIATYTAGSEPARGIYRKGNEIYVKTDAEKHLAGLIDEDNMASNSATRVPSQQSVRAYVTSGTVTMTNKTLTSPTINTPTIASAVLNTAVSGTAVLDEDTMASNSATKLATQQSIKAYVDTKIPQVTKSATAAKIVHAGGLIEQIFQIASTSDSDQTFNFPEAFPTVCINVTLSHAVVRCELGDDSGNDPTEKFTINRDDGIGGTSTTMYVRAVGY